MAQKQENSARANWAPLIILGALIACAYALGLQNFLSLENIAGHRSAVQDYVGNHLILALLIYCVTYIVVVATSLPAASFLSIAGGFVFGWLLSGSVTIIAATIGAVIVFQIVKTSLGAVIAARAGPFVQKLSDGFSKDAFNYLLFLRLVPAFPFFAVNAVAGLTRINLRTFILATLIGIIPGSYAFAWLGRGLDSVIDAQIALHDACVAKDGFNNCPYEFSVSSLVTPQLLAAFCGLGLVALIPVALKKWKPAK
jgi:uncharacterized membrane protein YdjX (TVP38/TMEM64 family)